MQDDPYLFRERVYRKIKELLGSGEAVPGEFLDLKAIGSSLGLSRTPLRDALLRLETEGFVTIHARRGVLVNTLDAQAIRNIYQILGALESAAIVETAPSLGKDGVKRMKVLNREMKTALTLGDFAAYYRANLDFHDTYIGTSANAELKRTARILKERLYDFPRRQGWVPDWEERSVTEHEDITRYLASGDFSGAADYARDVHWSFAVQEEFIARYYFGKRGTGGER